MMRLLRVAWDRLSLYLPIVLMGILALGTYWLVRSTPVFDTAAAPVAPPHEPDYTMRQFSVKTFDTAGKLKSEITGEQAKHYPDTEVIEIGKVHIRSFNSKGQLTIVTSDRAFAKSDGSEVELLGNAKVVREAVRQPNGSTSAALSFQGEHLFALLDEEKACSGQPVKLTRGQDQFTADTMQLDNLTQVIELKGRVRGTLAPAAPAPASGKR